MGSILLAIIFFVSGIILVKGNTKSEDGVIVAEFRIIGYMGFLLGIMYLILGIYEFTNICTIINY